MPVVPSTPAAIAEAAEYLRRGGLVAFPTETVYGLGADATNDLAVAAVFSAKGRPTFNPLIMHVPGVAVARRFAMVSSRAEALIRVFWPGPLTLVLPSLADTPVSLLATAGLDSVALRCPAHPVAQDLMMAARTPIAAPSANRSGHVSPTTAAHVQADLGDLLHIILEGGPAEVGLESTILDLTADPPRLLRPGAVTAEDIRDVIGVLPETVSLAAGARPTAPGQLESHYAPRAAVRLDATHAIAGEGLLSFGPRPPDVAGVEVVDLSPRADLVEAAANLFAALRALDARGVTTIAVMPIPDVGLGRAINDRLRRAAAPRAVGGPS